MSRVANLAIELKISHETILDFLYRRGNENANINSKLSDEEEKDFRKNFLKINDELNNPFEGFTENKFIEQKQNIYFNNQATIISNFTDQEAISICSKMSDGKIRYYAKEYSNNLIEDHKHFLKYQLHFLAMKALDFYGGYILTFILNLRIFPGKNKSAILLSASKKKFYETDPTLPELEFIPMGSKEKCYIRFSRKIEREKSSAAFIIYNKHRRPLYSFSSKGILITNFQNRFPRISIFREYINGQKRMYSGFDNIYCDICGRELSDELSVLFGRGPTCRTNYPI